MNVIMLLLYDFTKTNNKAADVDIYSVNGANYLGAYPSDELLDVLDKYANNSDKIPTLHYAVKVQDEKAVLLLLQNGMDVNKSSSLGYPLEIAFRLNNLSIAKILIANGAKIKGLGIEKGLFKTAMHNYARGNDEWVGLLFDSGFRPSMIDSGTVEEILSQKQIKSLEFILNAGLDVNKLGSSSLVNILKNNFQDGLELLIKYGYDLKQINRGGEILYNAIKNSSVKSSLIKYTILNSISCEYSSSPEIRYQNLGSLSIKGDSMLSAAVERGDLELIQMLIDRGVKLTCEYPLHIHFDTCIVSADQKQVEPKTVRVSTEDFNPLYVAIKNKRYDIVELLISKGAVLYVNDVWGGGGDGRTINSTKFDQLTWRNKVLFQQATFEGGIKDIIAALSAEQRKEEVNHGIFLMKAIQSQDIMLLNMLIQGGHPINFTVPNRMAYFHEKTPIKLAVEIGNREIIALLLSHGAEWDGV